jgi:hypothetical protein
MKIREILLEYNRDITIKNTNPNNIFNALKNDDSVALTPELEKLRKQLRSNNEINPDQILNLVEIIVAAIEEKDPTNHKEYTPWLVRMYSKGGVKYEDLNRMNMLGLYDVGKKRKIIRPEHKDINKFKTYQEFENVMFNNYPFDEFEEEEPKDKSIAKKVFENEEVLIVIPENEAAACKYGKGTRWCTAATRGENYFNQYNKKGFLYILIPKHPKYKGEKYQLHFETNNFMDENDKYIPLPRLLKKRFGKEVLEFFKNERPEVKNCILFMSDEKIEPIVKKIKEKAQEYFLETTFDLGMQDDDYYEYLKDKGLLDPQGFIDWDLIPKDESYLKYNKDLYHMYKNLEKDINLNALREFLWKNKQYYNPSLITIKHLASLFGEMLIEIGRKLPKYDNEWNIYEDVGELLRFLYVIPDDKNGWKFVYK